MPNGKGSKNSNPQSCRLGHTQQLESPYADDDTCDGTCDAANASHHEIRQPLNRRTFDER